MELNAKIASLEDEVKVLKGEVKLILSEIRTAILGQDNPFAEPGQALRADPGALESRPPIRVVRVSSDNEEAEPVDDQPQPQAIWPQETAVDELEPSPPPIEDRQATPEPAPAPPPARARESAPTPAPVAEPAPAPTPIIQAVPKPIPLADGMPRWSLITVAGLAVWAEQAIQQIGSERLKVLLDLCEFTGYLSGPAKEALLKVSSLAPATEEPSTPPSANEFLVILCQLDALLHGEEPAGSGFQTLSQKWQQRA